MSHSPTMFSIFMLTLSLFSACTALESSLVNFTSSPHTVVPSITENLTMTCSLDANLADNVDYISSIKVQRDQKTIASIERGSSAEVSDKADGHFVATGNIDGDGSNTYLNLVWKNPGFEESGEFQCYIEAIETDNKTEVYSASILVRRENPSTEDFANANRRIYELMKNMTDKSQEQIEKLKDEIAELMKDKAKLQMNEEKLRDYVSKLENKIQKPLHVESGHVYRSQYKTTPWPEIGRKGSKIYGSTIKIQFDKPYEKAPRVVLGITGFDHRHGKNGRIGLKVVNVTNSGFVAQCFTWAESVTHSISFSWISYGNSNLEPRRQDQWIRDF